MLLLQFYKNEFWDKYGIDQIKDPSVAAKFFDFAIATGRTLKSVGGVELLNKLSPSEAMARIAQVHRDVYLATIKKHPEQASFWAGWDKRTRSIPGDKTYLPTDIFKQIQDKITTATGPELLASTTTVPSGNYAKTHDTINYDNKLSFFENASKSADLTNAIDNLYNKVIQNASKDQLEYVMLKLLGHTQAYYANIQGT